MITINDLLAIENNGGLTLKKGAPITYRTGWQVATEGIETTDVHVAYEAIVAYHGNCGIWYSEGIYYIDRSHREKTKWSALMIGRRCNQISILKWETMELVYC